MAQHYDQVFSWKAIIFVYRGMPDGFEVLQSVTTNVSLLDAVMWKISAVGHEQYATVIRLKGSA